MSLLKGNIKVIISLVLRRDEVRRHILDNLFENLSRITSGYTTSEKLVLLEKTLRELGIKYQSIVEVLSERCLWGEIIKFVPEDNRLDFLTRASILAERRRS